MVIRISINCTQEKFEHILKKNPGVKVLDCSNCFNLTSIPKLVKLIQLDCTSCTNLTSIPQLDNLKKLDCSCCYKLTSIPQLDNLKELFCVGCKNLTHIPQLAKLEMLRCIRCNNLTSIPQLDNLKELYCNDCNNLTHIPQLDKLERLKIKNRFDTNLKLKNIGYFPNIKIYLTDFSNFKEQNEYFYKLKLVKNDVKKILENKKAEGFTDDIFRILEKY